MLNPTTPSPCINVCRMDPHSGLCLGCLRTLEEIAGWSRFSDITRLAVLERVDERRQQAIADKASKS